MSPQDGAGHQSAPRQACAPSSDPRYLGLTPAQSCGATLAAAIVLFAWIYCPPEPLPDRYLEATPWRVHLRDVFRCA